MKGVVFTEFLDMVDSKFGPDVTESIISDADLPSGGAYTSIGTYSHAEIVSLVVQLSKRSGHDVTTLVKVFGSHMLFRFTQMFPAFFEGQDDMFDFLESVDGYIHGEVRALYPDATLPKIVTARRSDGGLDVHYSSERMMGDLAEGLLRGAMDHFDYQGHIDRLDLDSKGGVQCVKFTIHPKTEN